jgi:hypothetical protein
MISVTHLSYRRLPSTIKPKTAANAMESKTDDNDVTNELRKKSL